MTPAKRRLLVAEDEELFRETIQAQLEAEGYEIVTAADGRTASELADEEKFDAVISDINMPELNGIDLLKAIKARAPTPVILMTGLSDIMQTKEAHEAGAAGFLAKPFRQDELFSLLKGLFGEVEEEPAVSDLDYCKLGMDDFVSGRQIQFGIYVRVAENNYVKVAHRGEDISHSRISQYKERGLRFLYMKREDFRRYLEFSRVIVAAAKSNTTIGRSRKLSLLRHANEVSLEHFHRCEISFDAFEDAKAVLETTLAIVMEQPESLDLIESLRGYSDVVYAQSLGVSLYSCLLAQHLNWKGPQTLYRLSIAGLFHDIGKKQIDRAIVDKPRASLTAEEVQLLHTHAARGAEILATLPMISEDILQIVLQHHENCAGNGYPARLPRSKIQPLARLLAVADEFCTLMLSDSHGERRSAAHATERLFVLQSETLDPVFLNALASLNGLEPAEICKKHGLRLRAG